MKKRVTKPWGVPQLIALAVALLLAAAAMTTWILWQVNDFTMNLTLNGPKEVTIEYGDSYEDPGAGAVFHGSLFFREPLDVEVTTDGQVDLETVGTYTITYTAKHTVDSIFGDAELVDTVQRTVRVVDTVAPTIVLTADPEVFTIPGEIYQEEGYTATDNYDGDITDKVVRTETEEAITYQVTDSSGNSFQIERPIVYFDPIAPELVLKGKESMSIKLGSTFEEPGYTATDNCDGDITDRVVVSGTVDTKKVGTYTLEYTVSDSYENTVTVTRKVKVYEPETQPTTKPTETKETKPKETGSTKPKETGGAVDPANPVGGVVYLTFDDGPSRHTARLLDILAKHNVKASFFVVNTGYISTVSRIASEGHTVAIHSATHKFKEIYASEEAFFADLEKMQSIIKDYTGKKPMLMRFPGGSSNQVSRFNEGIMTRLTKLVEDKGYTYFDWNVDSDDAGNASTALEVYNNVVKGIAKRKNSVVLLHDINGYTVDAIEGIIIWGKANGHTFQALTSSSPTCHHPVKN